MATRSGAALADELSGDLPVVERFLDVRPHVPGEVADAVVAAARAASADLVLSIGGGSTTGTAKAVALETGLPILAVPTTYAGSEATPVWGRTDAGHKTTGTDTRVLPRTVVYDAEQSVTLPVALSIASGLNALAHSVDALWAPHANPFLDASATEAHAVVLPHVLAFNAEAAPGASRSPRRPTIRARSSRPRSRGCCTGLGRELHR